MSSPKIVLSGKQGDVKRIDGSKVMRSMGPDALFHSNSASNVTSTPYTLDNSSNEWLIWRAEEWIEVSVEADKAGKDGQGINIGLNSTNCEVISVSGNVYIVRGKFIATSDDKYKIFSNTNRIAAKSGDILYSGDAIVAEAMSSTNFKLKISWPEFLLGASKYLAYGLVEDVLSTK